MCPNLLGFGWGLGGQADGTSLVCVPSDMATCSAEFLEKLVLVGIGNGLLSLLPVAVATLVVVIISATAVVVNKAASSKSAKAITYIAAIIVLSVVVN